MKKYNVVALGGTFDHFHRGHREFLQFALDNSQKLIVAITSEKYTKNLKTCVLDSFLMRRNNVEEFLKKCANSKKIELISIDNLFGPALDENFMTDAIFVTEESKKGAEKINEERIKRKLNAFPTVIFPFVKATDGKLISSTRIREGEVSREGKVYFKPIWLKSRIVLPEYLRAKLKKPLGDLFKNERNIKRMDFSHVLTVGDAVTKSFNDLSYGQKISVVDFYVKRKKMFSSLKDLGFSEKEKVIKIKNPAGSLTPSLFKSVKNIFKSKNKNRIVFKIEGEEDLCVLPFLIAAPLGFTIFYGQPDQGIVMVEVTEENKELAYTILDSFKLGNN